jgi:mono/diheme cytochrome c family protein
VKHVARIALAALLLLALASALLAWLNLRGEAPVRADVQVASDAATVARGAYLARIGNCAACHTVRGGAPYAGGRGIETPFGVVYASNLTPDAATGLGRWSADAFWRALHHGRSADGRLLYPAFPYPSYTLLTREDSDALFAYLRQLPPVQQPTTPHALRFPYNTQAALAVWRALYFRPARFTPDVAQTNEFNRGSYLVRGLGHCEACHAPRNLLGATQDDGALAGGLIPMQRWYAPSLAASTEAGVADWSVDEITALLKTGVAPRASVMGPMAEVVFRSTQYLTEDDARAMAIYLKALPAQAPAARRFVAADPAVLQAGEALYRDQCAACHGAQGEGVPGMYPALAGNRAVTLDAPNNVVRAVLYGGFAPATAGNPRPFGMPPFLHSLSDDAVEQVTTYIRQSWGHRAPPVSAVDVRRAR